MTYADEVRDTLLTDQGTHSILELLAALERADIPVRGITISVKVAPEPSRQHLGTLFGNVDIEVTT